MVMKSTLSLLLVVALTGCLGVEPPSPGDEIQEPTDTEEEASMDPVEGPPVLGDPVDPWDGAEEILLFEGTVEVAECYDVVTQAFITLTSTVFLQDVTFGCAEFFLPEGTLVPVGTGQLRIEGDATGATHEGSWAPYVTTYGYAWTDDGLVGYLEGEPKAEDPASWSFDLRPEDWEPEHHDTSEYTFLWFAWGGTVDVLYGPVETRVTAVRDPGWEPAAPIDHWHPAAPHAFARDDAIRLLDANVTLDQSNSTFAELRLDDIVPRGTSHVSVAMQWSDVEGCDPGATCRPWATVYSAGGFQCCNGDDEGSNHQIDVYAVPDEVGDDHNYTETSHMVVEPTILDCVGDPTSGFALYCMSVDPTRVELRVAVHAWQDEVDLAALKQWVGIG